MAKINVVEDKWEWNQNSKLNLNLINYSFHKYQSVNQMVFQSGHDRKTGLKRVWLEESSNHFFGKPPGLRFTNIKLYYLSH